MNSLVIQCKATAERVCSAQLQNGSSSSARLFALLAHHSRILARSIYFRNLIANQTSRTQQSYAPLSVVPEFGSLRTPWTLGSKAGSDECLSLTSESGPSPGAPSPSPPCSEEGDGERGPPSPYTERAMAPPPQKHGSILAALLVTLLIVVRYTCSLLCS